MDVLCVMCASVRLGSISTNETSLEILESFHCCGRNIFQLLYQGSAESVTLGSVHGALILTAPI